MVYNISFDIAALFITAIPLVFMKVRNDMQILENRIFFAILIMHLITTSLDILSSISNSYIDLFSISVRSLLNYLYIIMHGSEPIVFTIFIIVSLKLYINATKTQKPPPDNKIDTRTSWTQETTQHLRRGSAQTHQPEDK